MRRSAHEVIQDLEIRVAQLEKEALFGLDLSFNIDKVKDKITSLIDKIPFVKAIRSLFRKVFRVRSFKDAKKEAKKIIAFGERSKKAKEYLKYVMKEERTFKGRIALVLKHYLDPDSRPDLGFDRNIGKIADGHDAARGAWLMFCAWAICMLIKEFAIAFAGTLLLKIGIGVVAVFIIGVVILAILDIREIAKQVEKERENMERRKREKMARRVVSLYKTSSLVEHCIYEELRTKNASFKQANMIASTIVQQLGGSRKLQMFIGLKQIINYPNGVSLVFPKPKHRGAVNKVKITLNGKDLYDMEFIRFNKNSSKVVKEFNDVYAEDLRDRFEDGTGLYIRF